MEKRYALISEKWSAQIMKFLSTDHSNSYVCNVYQHHIKRNKEVDIHLAMFEQHILAFGHIEDDTVKDAILFFPPLPEAVSAAVDVYFLSMNEKLWTNAYHFIQELSSEMGWRKITIRVSPIMPDSLQYWLKQHGFHESFALETDKGVLAEYYCAL